jgi:chromosomal replication initiation ATPase DnaA
MREGDRTIDAVLDAVAAHFETTRGELISGRTHRVGRRVAMHRALRVTTLSIAQIASRVGGISWKNVVVGARTIEQRMAEDTKFAAEVGGIKASLLRE